MSEPRSWKSSTECPWCGKRSYRTKKIAKAAIRGLHPAERMNAYPCPYSSNDDWHIGHLDQALRERNARIAQRAAAEGVA